MLIYLDKETLCKKCNADKEWSFPSGKSISDHMRDFWEAYIDRTYFSSIVVLGHEVVQTGTGRVEATGDPSTLLITTNEMEILPGDLVRWVLTKFAQQTGTRIEFRHLLSNGKSIL